MKNQSKQQTRIPTCDFCKKAATYESVTTVAPSPFAILYHVGGEKIGLIKADLSKCNMLRYCADHVPPLEPTKLLWLDVPVLEDDPTTRAFPRRIITEELGRAAKTIGVRTGAVLTIEYKEPLGTLGIKPEDIRPIIEAVRAIYGQAAVIITEDYKPVLNIGIDPAYTKPITMAIPQVDKYVSARLKQTPRKKGKKQPKKGASVAIWQGDQILMEAAVCQESVETIIEVTFDIARPVTISMQHGDEVFKTQVNPKDMTKVMDAIIEVCSRK